MSTIREALESAAEGLETGGDGGAPAEVEAAPPPPSEGGDEAPAPLAAGDEGGAADANAAPEEKPPAKPGEAGRSRDGKGRFSQGDKAEAAAPVKGRPLGIGTPVKPLPTGPSLTPAPGAAAAPVKPAAPAAEGPKPPTSWKPAAREAWASLPPAVRAEVARVDREVVATMREATHARQFSASFNQAVAPYSGMMQAEGGPVNFIGGLLQTAQALRTAPPHHRAQVVANIVRQFGVPIEALDAALAGGPVPQAGQGQPGQEAQPGEYRDPRVDQLLGTLEQAKQQRLQAQQQRANADIQEFAKEAEFLNDVKPHMATLLHEAAQRGQAMTLQEAYERACWADPEVRVYFQQREAAKAANAQQASTQRARAAASSVKGRPAGSTTAPASSTIRGALEAAAARLSSR